MFRTRIFLAAFALQAISVWSAGAEKDRRTIEFAHETPDSRELTQLVLHGIEILQPNPMLAILSRQAVEESPRSALAHYVDSLVAYSNIEAGRCLKRALARSRHSSQGERRFIEAAVLLWEGKNESARIHLERLVQDYPRDRLIRMTLGNLYLNLGKTKSALLHLEQASRLDAGTARVYVLMAQAHLMRRDLDEAGRCYRKALGRMHSAALPNRMDWLVAMNHLQEERAERAIETIVLSGTHYSTGQARRANE